MCVCFFSRCSCFVRSALLYSLQKRFALLQGFERHQIVKSNINRLIEKCCCCCCCCLLFRHTNAHVRSHWQSVILALNPLVGGIIRHRTRFDILNLWAMCLLPNLLLYADCTSQNSTKWTPMPVTPATLTFHAFVDRTSVLTLDTLRITPRWNGVQKALLSVVQGISMSNCVVQKTMLWLMPTKSN